MDVQSAECLGVAKAPDREKGVVLSAVDKALIVLTSVMASNAPLSLTELTRRTGLPKSTAHRLLARLCAHGLLLRQDGLYRPGHRMAAKSTLESNPLASLLRAESTPYLVEVHIATGGTASAWLLTRNGPTLVNQIYNHRGVHAVPGSPVPSAVLKLLHAYEPESGGAIPGRPSAADLTEIRSTGFAHGLELGHGTTSAALAMRDSTSGQQWPAVLAVSGRIGCFDHAAAERALRFNGYSLVRMIRSHRARRHNDQYGSSLAC
ncbi:helix-turn-helix domain-containing protein [Lentzea sp. NPDC004782]|uniref:helix-turn-helix domain-containing protein n=1 Tax=Lentzea sp. NPDC004782 TaxID=3154458 RepID=UPI0033B86057